MGIASHATDVNLHRELPVRKPGNETPPKYEVTQPGNQEVKVIFRKVLKEFGQHAWTIHLNYWTERRIAGALSWALRILLGWPRTSVTLSPLQITTFAKCGSRSFPWVRFSLDFVLNSVMNRLGPRSIVESLLKFAKFGQGFLLFFFSQLYPPSTCPGLTLPNGAHKARLRDMLLLICPYTRGIPNTAGTIRSTRLRKPYAPMARVCATPSAVSILLRLYEAVGRA